MIVSRSRSRYSVLVISLIILSAVYCEANDFFYQTSTKQPHIIVILADDLGWNDVGFHGSDEIRTPNIDALAYNGVILHRHYSMATCTPSRAALLTGRYPIRLGMQGTPIAAGMKLGIPLNETLLPQHLKHLGYKTSLVGKWHVGCYRKEMLPTKRGFDSFFGYYNGYIGYYDGMHIDSGVGGLDARRGDSPAWHELVARYATEVLTQEASDVIRQHANQSQPLFLEVSHLAPHAGNVGGRLQVPNPIQTEKEFAHIKDSKRRVFAGMVKELDNSVGEIVQALNEAKMLEDSIIVFLSDNGAPTVEPVWQTGNSGSNWPLRGEKASLHEGGIRTVGAIWSTRIARSSTIYNQNFHLVDWLPTLYAAAGGDTSNLTGIDGVNHWDSISGLEPSQELAKPNRTLLLNIDDVEGAAALMHGRWKLIKNNATSKLSFTNGYFGAEGTGPNTPPYNITSVLDSQVGQILSKLNPNPQSKMADTFLQLRYQSTVSCLNLTTAIHPDNECYKSHCLYDLESDPCESENLLEKLPELGKTMTSLLENFEKQIRPRPPYIFDEAALPKNFDNYWAVWVGSDNSSMNLSQNYLLVLLSFLCILSYR